MTLFLLKFLPKNHLSHFVGWLVHLRLPNPLRMWSMRTFAEHYKINLFEAEKPLSEYQSIGDLFTRKLKPGVRPIAKSLLVHPCDSVMSQHGLIQSQTLIQAKGKSYALADFVKSESWAQEYDGGYFITYYLCPTDYHRVHSPATGAIQSTKIIPGQLWPVNVASVNSIDRLFAINERVVSEIKTESGNMLVVFVGATNVGQISLAYDETVRTNYLPQRTTITDLKYEFAKKITKGEELGTFHMGSTIVLILSKTLAEKINTRNISSDKSVKMGEEL